MFKQCFLVSVVIKFSEFAMDDAKAQEKHARLVQFIEVDSIFASILRYFRTVLC